jgi:tRNA (cmo5U34)-methyltransferase
MDTKDKVMPDGKWTFDGDVTEVFDDMLTRSIPQYDVMRKAVYDLACQYIQPHTGVISLGSSRGEDVAALIDKYQMKNRFHLTDVSEPMLETLKERFAHSIAINSVSVQYCDLRNEYPLSDASITLCILTLQFTPIEYRLKILQNVYNNLLPGGAFIIVEKVLGSNSEIDEKMIEIYYKMKADNGYTGEQIERKRLSLEGVLVPLTARWNEDMLRNAGFNHIDCFWRWMNFAGWIAIKS